MNVQAEKIELVKMLLETEDKSLLKDIRSLFSRKEDHIQIPQHVINGVRESQQQLKDGQSISFSDVMQDLRKI